MRGILILLLAAVAYAGCGTVIRGLDNGYGAVNNRNRATIGRYAAGEPLFPSPDTGKILYEITAAEVRHALAQSAGGTTCVVVWVPWCTGKHCLPLSYYDRAARKAAERGAAFFLISDQYDLREIRRQRERFGYAGRMFTMQHERYGRQNRGAQTRQFVSEMLGMDRASDSMAYAQCFVFVGSELRHYGHVDEMMKTPEMRAIVGEN